jgi:hypothetical protein
MKIHRIPPKFTPVSIELTSEEEVKTLQILCYLALTRIGNKEFERLFTEAYPNNPIGKFPPGYRESFCRELHDELCISLSDEKENGR